MEFLTSPRLRFRTENINGGKGRSKEVDVQPAQRKVAPSRAIIDFVQTADTRDEPVRREETRNPTRRWLFFGAALTVIAVDQATKILIRSLFERGETWPDGGWDIQIHYVTNTGAAFGMFQDQTLFLTAMAVIGLFAIYLYYRFPPFDHFVVPIAIGMMLGGAAGNLIDRIAKGRVTDFIDFPRFPAFNVADASISVGIAVILIGYLLWGQHQESSE